MEIAIRRLEVLRSLPISEDFVRPMDIGGYNCSYHSRDLLALDKLGFVEKKRAYKGKSKGHWEYRLTQKGQDLVSKINSNKSIKAFRVEVLSKKNGIRARYTVE